MNTTRLCSLLHYSLVLLLQKLVCINLSRPVVCLGLRMPLTLNIWGISSNIRYLQCWRSFHQLCPPDDLLEWLVLIRRVTPKHAHAYQTDYTRNTMHSDSVSVAHNSLATAELRNVSDVTVKVRAPIKYGGRAYLKLLLIIIHKNI